MVVVGLTSLVFMSARVFVFGLATEFRKNAGWASQISSLNVVVGTCLLEDLFDLIGAA
jgi:hypothetical protein